MPARRQGIGLRIGDHRGQLRPDRKHYAFTLTRLATGPAVEAWTVEAEVSIRQTLTRGPCLTARFRLAPAAGE
jgi:hypothetical protein